MLLIAAALLPGLADKRAISDISLLFNCSSLAAKTCSVTPLTTKYRSTIFSGVRRFSITAFDDGVVFLTLGIFGETSATTPRPFAPVEVIAVVLPCFFSIIFSAVVAGMGPCFMTTSGAGLVIVNFGSETAVGFCQTCPFVLTKASRSDTELAIAPVVLEIVLVIARAPAEIRFSTVP